MRPICSSELLLQILEFTWFSSYPSLENHWKFQPQIHLLFSFMPALSPDPDPNSGLLASHRIGLFPINNTICPPILLRSSLPCSQRSRHPYLSSSEGCCDYDLFARAVLLSPGRWQLSLPSWMFSCLVLPCALLPLITLRLSCGPT